MKDYARKFYQGKAWRDTQAAYMASQHYTCERCGGLARVVHHKEHITPQNIGDVNITLAWDNLEALCMDCHNMEHSSSPATVADLRFDHDGNLVSLAAQGNFTPPTFAPHSERPRTRAGRFQFPSKEF